MAFPAPPRGCYSDVPEADYHASEGLSVSRLKRHRKAAILSTVDSDEETRAQKFGTLIHATVLEPDSIPARFYVTGLKVINENHAATKAELEKAAGRTLVKQAEYDEAQRIRDAIMRHPAAREMLAPGLLTEQSFYWVDPATGLLCRGRADGLRLEWRAVVDLKSTEDASAEGFARSCTKYLYDWQEAYYREGIEASCGWEPQAFFFLACEKTEPWIVKPWTIHPADVAQAADEVAEERAHYLRCVQAGDFPAYGDDVGTLRIGYRSQPSRQEPTRREPAPMRLLAA